MIFSSLKPVILRDSDPFRKNIYSDLKSRSPLIRYIEYFYSRSPSCVKAWLLIGYGLKSFADAPALDGKLDCVYSYDNEEKRFEYLTEVFGDGCLSFRRTSLGNFSLSKCSALFAGVQRLPALYRALHTVGRKYDFLVSCRLASTMFYYMWFDGELERKRPAAVLLSSEANPYAAALTWSCRKHHVPSIYVPHGQVAPNPPRLFNDIALLDGEELKSTFEARGKIRGKVIYKGADGEFLPLRTDQLFSLQTVGVFLSITYDPEKLEHIIRDISRTFTDSTVLIRLHPNLAVASDEIVSRVKDLRIRVSKGRTLSEDIAECGLVFCGNSGTHLEVLRQGVPTVQVNDLDTLPHDTRKFIANRVVPWYQKVAQINTSELISFYGPEWIQRMRRYDFHYGKSREEIIAYLRKEIGPLVQGQTGKSG